MSKLTKKYCKYKKKQCTHYTDSLSATLDLVSFESKKFEKGHQVPIRVYKCKCGYWHLTKQLKREGE
jgi:hypothetical protein